MKKQLIILALALLLFAPVSYAKKLATIPELLKPGTMAVDNEQFYTVDNCTVFIYSLKDFKLVKKFGKSGEGPREFMASNSAEVSVLPQKDYLIVNSLGKVSFYKKDGTFIKEMKSPSPAMSSLIQPIGKDFVGMNFEGSAQDRFISINLFNEKLEKVKELSRKQFMDKGAMFFPSQPPICFALGDKIVIAGEKGFELIILDKEGKIVTTIKREYKSQKVTQEYKNGVYDFFKTNQRTKPFFEYLKKNVVKFSEFYPPIQLFFVSDGKIYVQTYLAEGETSEFFIFKGDGKFLKRVLLPYKKRFGLFPFPFAIKNNIFYQLIETDDEEWELHASKIE
ncbi:MAG: hypothetical protein GY757_09300 [bacterium]|nr:hypothetical protein [bacterium]